MNAGRARVLRGLGTESSAAATELVLRALQPHLSAFLTGAQEPAGWLPPLQAGAPPDSDPLAADMRHFTREVARLLDAHRLAGDFRRLGVFAARAVAGMVEEEFPPRLARTIVFLRIADLIRLPATKIETAAATALARFDDGRG